jgi:hypothetical protein
MDCKIEGKVTQNNSGGYNTWTSEKIEGELYINSNRSKNGMFCWDWFQHKKDAEESLRKGGFRIMNNLSNIWFISDTH